MAALCTGATLNSNNHGKYRVVSDDGAYSVCIEFIKTGYRNIVRRDHASNGNVKDRFSPAVCGVGFIGEGAKSRGGSNKTYNTWANMLERCYSPKLHQKYPTYIGCTVVLEWHNFQNFAQWYEENHKPGLHLDKDIKIHGNRIYGPDTCLFVTQSENAIKANAKHYVFLSPKGVRHEVYNLSQFARVHGLSRGNMVSVNIGSRNHHAGWTKPHNQGE